MLKALKRETRTERKRLERRKGRSGKRKRGERRGENGDQQKVCVNPLSNVVEEFGPIG